MSWLPGWKKRIPWTVDHDDIDSAVAWFPVRLHLSVTSGTDETEEQTEQDTQATLRAGLNTRIGQKLTISNRTVTKLSFYIFKYGSPTGDVTFTIRQTDDTILASKVLSDASALETTATWEVVTLDTPILINEEVRISCEFSGGSPSNGVRIRHKLSDVKASECLSYYDGSWHDEGGNGNNYDCAYKYAYGGIIYDVSCVFDEVGANSKKIAITKADGTTELYGEIEKWDNGNEEAELRVSRDGWAVSDSADTDGYLYYDNTHADNDTYIGVKNSTPAQSVWDGIFAHSYRMADGVDNAHIYDSTSSNQDGTKKGANEPNEVDAKIGKGQDFDGSDDYIDLGDPTTVDFAGAFAFEAWVNVDNYIASGDWVLTKDDGTNRQLAFYLDAVEDNSMSPIIMYWHAAGLAYWYTTDGIDLSGADHHVVAGRTADSVFIIVDGVSKALTTSGSLYEAVKATAATMYIGHRNYKGALTYLDGKVYELTISTSARSGGWWKASYESGRDHLITWGSEELLQVWASYQQINPLGVNIYSAGRSR